jgi:hypothetical protein
MPIACAAELCRAVKDGQVPYIQLTPALNGLRDGIIRDAYDRSELAHWERYEASDGYDGFKREAVKWIEQSEEWRGIQQRRIELARRAPVANAVVPGQASFDPLMAEARKAALERPREALEARWLWRAGVIQSPYESPEMRTPVAPREQTITGGSPPSRAKRFPTRAGWLKREMENRDRMTQNRLHKLSDVDRKTINRVLSGEPVSSKILEKLADGLSRDGWPKVTHADIPSD